MVKLSSSSSENVKINYNRFKEPILFKRSDSQEVPVTRNGLKKIKEAEATNFH